MKENRKEIKKIGGDRDTFLYNIEMISILLFYLKIKELNVNGSRINERKEKRDGIPTRSRSQNGGYGEIGRRYGLDWIEPWYGNILSDNFQIQRNPGIKNGQS